MIGSSVIVEAKVVLPESKVPPRSAVVAARAAGRTINPWTNASTYLLFVASVSKIGSAITLTVCSILSIWASKYLLLTTSWKSIGSSTLIMRCVPALITASDNAKLKLRFPGTEIVLAVIVNSPISARFNSLISSVDCPRVIAVLPKVIF